MDIEIAFASISPFIGPRQSAALIRGRNGEEWPFFQAKIAEIAATIASMPKTYEQDGKGDDAVAFLHYFFGSWDWYITEKDMLGNGTAQAFGLVKGFASELGYISIGEITDAGAELDLHWTPCPLASVWLRHQRAV